MGNTHHPAKYLLALVVWIQHFTSQYGLHTLEANRILLRSQILCRVHVRSVPWKSGSYFTQKPAGQQIAARTVTELSVTKGRTRLFKPPQRMLHALTPELWEDKRAASQSACLPPQTTQKLGREVSAHTVGTKTPVPRQRSYSP